MMIAVKKASRSRKSLTVWHCLGLELLGLLTRSCSIKNGVHSLKNVFRTRTLRSTKCQGTEKRFQAHLHPDEVPGPAVQQPPVPSERPKLVVAEDAHGERRPDRGHEVHGDGPHRVVDLRGFWLTLAKQRDVFLGGYRNRQSLPSDIAVS